MSPNTKKDTETDIISQPIPAASGERVPRKPDIVLTIPPIRAKIPNNIQIIFNVIFDFITISYSSIRVENPNMIALLPYVILRTSDTHRKFLLEPV